jgi:hypothetical protein
METRSLGRRMHVSVEENFVGVNIADARDQSLIHENGFHGTAMLLE